MTRSLADRLKGPVPLLALILGCATFGLSWWNVQLQTQNQELQNMIYNYPPELFTYPERGLLYVDLNEMSVANGVLDLVVVIVTPHDGYGTVNQTSFELIIDDYTAEFLDQRLLKLNNVKMYGEFIFAVSAGSSQATLHIPFSCDVMLYPKWKAEGTGGSFTLGIVGITVTYYDVQASRTYTTATTVPVRVEFRN